MPKALVIYNPVSGAKSLKNVPDIIQRVLKKHNYDYTWFETQKLKKQPLNQFAKKRFQRIIAIGGDGTVAEVIAFMVKNRIKTPLIIIPQGSANILAATLRIPLLNIKKALTIGLTKESKPLDAMQINRTQYGVIAAGMGYDVMMMKGTTRKLKRKIGLLAYGWTFLKTFLYYRAKPYRLTIDGKKHYLNAKAVMVFNILPFVELPIRKFPKIRPNDQQLNIIALNPCSLLRWFSGKHRRIQIFSGQEVSIKPKKESEYQVDGDLFKGKSLQIKIIPKAINIVYV
jgi:diacylglycerol kinase family enzyme